MFELCKCWEHIIRVLLFWLLNHETEEFIHHRDCIMEFLFPQEFIDLVWFEPK